MTRETTIRYDETKIEMRRQILKLQLRDDIAYNASREQIYTAMVQTAINNSDEWIKNIEKLRFK